MKKNNTLWPLLLALSSLFAACKKDAPQDELSKLPPATQTGANTFGCLVNGKAWVAQTDCKFLCDPSFAMYYDNSNGGYIGITADWVNTSTGIKQRIDLIFDSTNHKVDHLITIDKPLSIARFINYTDQGNCSKYERFVDSTVVHSGLVNITKYDLQNGIISGKFSFTLTKPGCPTLAITDGRFDKKLF